VSTQPAVVLLGDVMVDLLARLEGPLAHGSDSPARISAHGGGAAGNTASWLVAAGVRATLLGRIGQDAAGRAIEADLRGAGVEVRFTADPELATGLVLVLVDPDGERTMVPDPGANASLRAEHLPAEVFRGGAHLHLSGYTLLKPRSRDAGLAALGLARSAGMTVSVDAASAGPLASAGPRRFLDWIAGVDLLFANRQEALLLAGVADPPHAAARVLAERVGTAVVKLGAQGAMAQGPDGAFACVSADARDDGPAAVPDCAATDPAALDSAALDTTGAGDAFAAGFLAAWLGGSSLESALDAGTALAARAVRTTGARPNRNRHGIDKNIYM
jgi:sugar/nucleoside kinase (ribokinase family)